MINTDPDFISSNKFGNSLKEFMNAHQDEISDKTISKLLKITTEELEKQYQAIISKLKIEMEK